MVLEEFMVYHHGQMTPHIKIVQHAVMDGRNVISVIGVKFQNVQDAMLQVIRNKIKIPSKIF